MHLSIVTPCFNEEANLSSLFESIRSTCDDARISFEWIVVDDHSKDHSFDVLKELAQKDARVRAYRLSRNFGSHAAIRCGLQRSTGDCVVMLAGDGQDSPAMIPDLVKRWKGGAQVLIVSRESRKSEGAFKVLFARLFYGLVRTFFNLKEIPPSGSDSFLIDRKVVEALSQFGERNANLFALICWMGFRYEVVGQPKQPRKGGRSGWTLEKKLKLLVDSVTAFSYRPIRLMTQVGVIFSSLGFVYASLIVFNAFSGTRPQGWASLMVALMVIGGILMMMLGVLGEYLWRSLDESRNRPAYLIEDQTAPLSSLRGSDMASLPSQ